MARPAEVIFIRTSWVFASKGKNFLTTIARLAGERPELRIVADQIGALTSARSIAQGVVSIIGSRAEREAGSVLNSIRRRFAEVDGLVHMSSRGATNWHGFATAIVDGLRVRGQQLAVHNIAAIDTKDYPTRAARPLRVWIYPGLKRSLAFKCQIGRRLLRLSSLSSF